MKIAEIRKAFDETLGALSKALAEKKLSPGTIAEAMFLVRSTTKTLEAHDKILKPTITDFLKEHGEVKKDGQVQKEWHVGGWIFKGFPKLGTDPKKFLARLIAKDIKPKKYMKEVISYELHDEGILKAQKDGVFTEAEIKEMAFDESWTIKTPEEE